MKTLLTIIFLIASQYGEAQYFKYNGMVMPELTDTLLVMILVTDKSETRKDGIMPAYSTLAYSVRKWVDAHEVITENGFGRFWVEGGWVHFKYLDILKRPLGENIVVWLSK